MDMKHSIRWKSHALWY